MSPFSGDAFVAAEVETAARLVCLVGLAGWSLLHVKLGRSLPSLLVLCVCAFTVHEVWLSPLPRPYGLLTDAAVTERLATAGVVAETGNARETCLAKEPNPTWLRDSLVAAAGPEPETLLMAFGLLGALALPACAVAIYSASSAPWRFAAAAALLLFWPAGAHLVRSPELLPPSLFWGDPWSALGFPLFVGGALTLFEARRTAFAVAGIALLLAGVFVEPSLGGALASFVVSRFLLARVGALGESKVVTAGILVAGAAYAAGVGTGIFPGPSGGVGAASNGEILDVLDILIWATLGQALWIGLSFWSVFQFRSRLGEIEAPLHFFVAGFLFLLWHMTTEALPMGTPSLATVLTFYRLGTILLAAPAIVELLDRARSAWRSSALTAEGALSPTRRGWGPDATEGVLLFVCAVASPLYLFNPDRVVETYRLSQAPLPDDYLTVARWIRENTPRDATFIANRTLAPLLGTVAGRRFLTAAGFLDRPEEPGSSRAEDIILGGRRPERILRAARRYGVTHLAIERGADRALSPEDFEGRPPFEKIYEAANWLYVYRIADRE